MIERHQWIAAMIFTALMALLMAEPVPAGMGGGSPLDEMHVVQWPENLCTQEHETQSREWSWGSGFVPIPWAGKIQAHDGIAWPIGLTVTFRECCVCREGFDCETERICEEAGTVPGFTPAGAIYRLDSQPFDAVDVAEWNEKHTAAAPTATPVPPTPVPTPPGPPLGACCFDPEKPWVCGQAIENTCLNLQSGFRWVEGEPCSTDVCQP
jgi:hypothetical protein